MTRQLSVLENDNVKIRIKELVGRDSLVITCVDLD